MNPGTNTGGTPPAGSSINLDLSLSENSALTAKGSSKIVQNILLINTGTNIVALSSICTHQGCTVGYNPSRGDIECPCHGSVFSTSGSVLNGPATSPLRSYSVAETGNVLTIML
jgi:cytochrome b6-f complex iron-sulfur subunit